MQMTIIDEYREQIKEIQDKINEIQDLCSHPTVACDDNTVDTGEEWARIHVWTTYHHCRLCDKRWTSQK